MDPILHSWPAICGVEGVIRISMEQYTNQQFGGMAVTSHHYHILFVISVASLDYFFGGIIVPQSNQNN